MSPHQAGSLEDDIGDGSGEQRVGLLPSRHTQHTLVNFAAAFLQISMLGIESVGMASFSMKLSIEATK